jgi:hypothetical protein
VYTTEVLEEDVIKIGQGMRQGRRYKETEDKNTGATTEKDIEKARDRHRTKQEIGQRTRKGTEEKRTRQRKKRFTL